jgi:lipopolysaccharide transport system permease protein
VLPVVAVAVPLLDLLAALPVLLVFLVASGGALSPTVLLLPVVLALQFFFVQGIGFLVAGLHVTFRDVQHLLGVGLAMLFYLTPVFYSPDMVPSWARLAYDLNPMTLLLASYRRILMDGSMPDWWMLSILAVVDAVLLRLGWATFVRARFAFVEEL